MKLNNGLDDVQYTQLTSQQPKLWQVKLGSHYKPEQPIPLQRELPVLKQFGQVTI
jgi:hypothetical protein